MVIDYLNSEVSQPPFHNTTDPPPDRIFDGMVTNMPISVGIERRTHLLPPEPRNPDVYPGKSMCIRLRGRLHPLWWKWRKLRLRVPSHDMPGKVWK